ncbi:hypothetical protein VNO80_20440 [Phaseolus coccineus]|uniref:RING-type E3 ubiquitin transferase n=1 Tax=Phaseolus coccineus TaxID=3886 RepID=A0AAN9MHN5_PHACN
MITTLISILTVSAIALVLKIQRLVHNNKLYRRNYSDGGSEGDCCSVCLCQISDGGKIRTLPGCHHSFHLHCIALWFNNHSTCPLCRNNITLPDHNHTPPQLFRDSLLHFFHTFSDIFIALHYLLFPTPTNRESLPLFH